MIIPNQHGLIFKAGIETQKIHCPKCHQDRGNKADKSLSINIPKGVFNCHHCHWTGHIDGWKMDMEKFDKPKRTGWSKLGDKAGVFLKSRGFSLATIEKNKLIQKSFGGEEKIGYPYFIPDEVEPVNIKWRGVSDKSFGQEKNAFRVLYNIPLWIGCEELIFVEGENDVIALNECGFWNATTLSDGAINEADKSVDGKLTSLHNSYHYVKNIKSFIIAGDNDPSGRRLRDELIKVFGPEKCKTVDWPEELKDANKAFLENGKEFVVQSIQNAQKVPVSGVMRLRDRKKQMLESFRSGKPIGDTTWFGQFDEYFRWKKGQTNLWTGYMNMGKSTFLNQLCLTKSIMDGWKWAIFSPENYPADDFYDDLIEMYVGQHVSNHYGNIMTEEKYLEACDFIDEHIIFVYPEDAHSLDSLHEIFKHMVLEYGIDGVIADPYNQIDKIGAATTEQEVAEFMKTTNKFAKFYNIVYNIVIHPKNLTLPKDSEFKAADTQNLAGGAMWGNMAYDIVSAHRPEWFTNRLDPKIEIVTQKIKRKRTGGQQGTFIMYFDFMRSRFHTGLPDSNERKYYCNPDRKATIEYFEEMDKPKTISPEASSFSSTNSSQDINEAKEEPVATEIIHIPFTSSDEDPMDSRTWKTKIT